MRSDAPTSCRDARDERDALSMMREAACDRSYVSMGSRRTSTVHEFYRYPARFSPDFAGSVIDAFTKPGDLIVDPFVGGGTTLVEARLRSRFGIGADVNELAVFVAKAKTTIHSELSLDAARHWADRIPDWLNLRRRARWSAEWEDGGYLRHLHAADTWRIRNAIALALARLRHLQPSSAQTLARCAVLRTGQWALDMRQEVPPLDEFREKLVEAVHSMADVAATFGVDVRHADKRLPRLGLRRTNVLSCGLPGLADHPALARYARPRLVLTSPPYPGVYVNYHRWKLRGRKETAAPFWIAGCPDGRGLSHYTMSARVDGSLDRYFARLNDAWTDLVRLIGKRTWIVQMVGFHDSDAHLDRYLDVMDRSGLEEVLIPDLSTASDGRLWREVPSRRWWVVAGERDTSAPHTSREVVLVHRLADT